MSYQGESGLYTVFPTAPKRTSSARSAPAGRACKYGARLANGRCPPKPASAKPACAYGPRLANGRCPPKPRTAAGQTRGIVRSIGAAAGAKRGSGTDQALGAVGGALGSLAARRAKAALRTRAAGAGAAAVLAKIGTRGAAAIGFGAIGAAGLAAYFITKRILENRAFARAERADQAFEVAQAYRAARLEGERLNRGPLTPRQQSELALEFKKQLQELGLSTDQLSGLRGSNLPL